MYWWQWQLWFFQPAGFSLFYFTRIVCPRALGNCISASALRVTQNRTFYAHSVFRRLGFHWVASRTSLLLPILPPMLYEPRKQRQVHCLFALSAFQLTALSCNYILNFFIQMAFIIVAGICLCLYFLFLCFMVFQVFRNISGKQSTLPAMSKARRLHYEVRNLGVKRIQHSSWMEQPQV